MDSTQVLIAVITGIFGLFGLVLSGSLWAIFKGMIEALQKRVVHLDQLILSNQTKSDSQITAMQTKVDKIETDYYQKQLEVVRLEAKLEEYVTLAQLVQSKYDKLAIDFETQLAENDSLRQENGAYQDTILLVVREIVTKLEIGLDDPALDGSILHDVIKTDIETAK